MFFRNVIKRVEASNEQAATYCLLLLLFDPKDEGIFPLIIRPTSTRLNGVLT
jgi:hypothetical protein